MLGQFDLDQEKTQEDQDLFSKIKSKIEEIRNTATRTAQESIWMTNIAYLCGADGLYFNSKTRSFQPVNNAGYAFRRRRINMNKVLPTVQNRLARLCKSAPKFDVRPESNDTEDKEAARLGTQILETIYLNERCNEKRLSLVMWVQQAGHAYIKVCWDKSKGKLVEDPMTGETTFEGDLRIDVVSPFEVFADPAAKSFEDALNSYLIHAKVRPLDYFRLNYEKGHLVEQEDTWLMSLQYENRIQGLSTKAPGSDAQQSPKNCAVEIIKYEARSQKYPNGRMIVCANGVILEDKELPCGEIPFARFDDVIVGGKYYPESIITHLRPIQDQYNETIRKRADWLRSLLAGKYAVSRGAGIKREQMTDESAELIYFDPVPNAPNGGMPTALPIPTIPQYAYAEEDRLIGMFNDLSGIGEVSRGTLPSASIPAIGMQLLTEQDDTRIGIVTEQHEHAWARVGNLILKYVEKYYILPRKLKIAGSSNAYMVKDITGDMLKGNTDVIVIRGSMLPGSKTLKRQEILNAYGQGLLGDPADPKVREKVLDLTEFGDVQGIWEDYSLDMNQIKRGIDQIERGETVIFSEFDNHALWAQELNRLRKNDKFNTFDPTIQATILDLLEQHIQALVDLQGGGPPPPADLVNPVTPEEVMQNEADSNQDMAPEL